MDSRLIYRSLSRAPLELAPAPLLGRLLRHHRASPSAALDKAIRLITVTQASAQSQSPDLSVSFRAL